MREEDLMVSPQGEGTCRGKVNGKHTSRKHASAAQDICIDWMISAELSDSEFSADDDENEGTDSLYFSDTIPKLQFRKDASVARWDATIGMAEVIERKGKMWTSTGILRKDKLLCFIEEVMFMVECGALLVLDNNDSPLSVENIYSLLTGGRYGCTWECYQAYCKLKSLGYIVGRHKCPWTCKSSVPIFYSSYSSEDPIDDAEEMSASKHFVEADPLNVQNNPSADIAVSGGSSLYAGSEDANNTDACSNALASLKIHEAIKTIDHLEHGLKLYFDVYHPNAHFKKSAPGLPDFILCIAREYPPSIEDVKKLQRSCMGIPIKFASVQFGSVNYYSFNAAQLSMLP